MFESLKHWFESIEDDSRLFKNADDEVLHSALASLLYHFISLEERHDGREKHEFDRIMKGELGLGQAQADHLYQAARTSTRDPHGDLAIIDAHLNDNPAVRMRFMQELLRIIDLHGAHSAELKLFHEALHDVFPEVKDAGGRDDV